MSGTSVFGILTSSMITSEKKQAVVKDLQSHKTDTGSSAVQVGITTERIKELTEHLKDEQEGLCCPTWIIAAGWPTKAPPPIHCRPRR